MKCDGPFSHSKITCQDFSNHGGHHGILYVFAGFIIHTNKTHSPHLNYTKDLYSVLKKSGNLQKKDYNSNNQYEVIKMKKFIATILSMAIVMSLAACSGKQPGQSEQSEQETNVPNVMETEVPLTEPTKATEPVNLATDFVKCNLDKITVGEGDDKEEYSFYVPELLIKSSYADSVNKEIASAYESFKKNHKSEDDLDYSHVEYIAYLTKEGILSLVFIIYTDTDASEYKVYNIDTKTGEKVENARIAQTAGVSDIRKAAMDALQNCFNKEGEFELKDYKVVSEKNEDNEGKIKDIEDSFSEEYLNDKMPIGLTNEGKLFFVSKISQASGTEFYDWIYDSDGVILDDMDNPYWVGDKDRFEEDDGKSKETTPRAYKKEDYIKDKVVKFKIKDEYNKKKKKWTYYTSEHHFPELLIKSSYADSINKAMDKLVAGYKKDYKRDGDVDCSNSYIAYLSNEGILSLVIIFSYENDQYECKVYNIDVKTGEKVDNARIAQIAGVSNIRKAAMDALQNRYNKEKHYKVKDYKVVKKKGQKKNVEDKAVEKSFNEKHLNDKMKIGLTNEGKIFFVSGYFDGCCEDNDTVYDANGKDLLDEKNPNWVGQKDD